MSPVTLATIEEAVAEIRDGRMIIIVDDEIARTKAIWFAPPSHPGDY